VTSDEKAELPPLVTRHSSLRGERKPDNLLAPEVKSAMLTAKDEERIRRAVRHAVRFTREKDTDHHIEYLFDLVPYLKDAALAIAREEAILAMSEIMGAD
jgi:hypothetical protein